VAVSRATRIIASAISASPRVNNSVASTQTRARRGPPVQRCSDRKCATLLLQRQITATTTENRDPGRVIGVFRAQMAGGE